MLVFYELFGLMIPNWTSKSDISLSLSIYIYLSLSLSLSLSVCLSGCLSVGLGRAGSCRSVSLERVGSCLSVYLSVCRSVCRSVGLKRAGTDTDTLTARFPFDMICFLEFTSNLLRVCKAGSLESEVGTETIVPFSRKFELEKNSYS